MAEQEQIDAYSAHRDSLSSLSVFAINVSAFCRTRMQVDTVRAHPEEALPGQKRSNNVIETKTKKRQSTYPKDEDIQETPRAQGIYRESTISFIRIGNDKLRIELQPPDMAANYTTIMHEMSKHSLQRIVSVNSPHFSPNMPDINKMGILYQFCGHYYIITIKVDGPNNECLILQGWQSTFSTSKYLLSEWESLPRTPVGRGCGVPRNIPDDDRAGMQWKAQSAVVQQLRHYCLDFAQGVDKRTQKLMLEKRVVSTSAVRKSLTSKFQEIVEKTFVNMSETEKKQKQDQEDIFSEFLVFDDEDGAV